MPVLLASFHHPRQRVLCRTQPMHAADKGRLLSERVLSYWEGVGFSGSTSVHSIRNRSITYTYCSPWA